MIGSELVLQRQFHFLYLTTQSLPFIFVTHLCGDMLVCLLHEFDQPLT